MPLSIACAMGRADMCLTCIAAKCTCSCHEPPK
jgi:hypothetical protein